MNLIDSGKISGKQGKEVFAEMFATGKSAAAIVKEKGIEQLSDVSAIEKLCDEVIAANPKPVADFRAGNAASLNFLKGQVIKLSKGKANPQLVGEILETEIEGSAVIERVRQAWHARLDFAQRKTHSIATDENPYRSR